ncbi:hypothetical protein [Kineococcus sp. SYSU DK001]|uniref:hypothetical protein n=1 Tax=Kineococcus sp. SYSU DK001 TaxID=3383122 RepID=UPI003D7E3F61
MRVEQPERSAPVRRPPAAVEEPTAVGWLRRLAEVSSPEQALQVWSGAALATGCLGMDLGPRELQRLGEWLVGHCDDQPIRMAVRSCLVRLHVHRTMRTAAARA